MDIETIFKSAQEKKASDIFIISNLPLCFKIDNQLIQQSETLLKPEDTQALIQSIYTYNHSKHFETVLNSGDDDFSIGISKVGRFRVNVYKQRNTLAAVIHIIQFSIPDYKDLLIPESVINISKKTKGLVLITGPAGSGKSTTLACIVDKINKTKSGHIITLEDPMEYIHPHKTSVVSQREIPSDTETYITALRGALRQAPNVILLGEMRDLETISTAMTAAETGQLVLSSLHTLGAANTIDRIIDVFTPSQQNQIRMQLSMVLQTVVSQLLLPGENEKMFPAFEIMHVTPAIRNMIREKRIYQIDTAIYASQNEGMTTMDLSIFNLWKSGKILRETALHYCMNYEEMFVKTKGNR
jgi:twitching motility protein PilT